MQNYRSIVCNTVVQIPAVELLLNNGVDAKTKTYDDLTILGQIAFTSNLIISMIGL